MQIACTKPEICFATSIVRIRTILGGADVKEVITTNVNKYVIWEKKMMIGTVYIIKLHGYLEQYFTINLFTLLCLQWKFVCIPHIFAY